MNIRLIACMLFAVLAGATAAWMVLNLGWGWLAAFALYSLGGTFALAATATVLGLADMVRRRPGWSQGPA